MTPAPWDGSPDAEQSADRDRRQWDSDDGIARCGATAKDGNACWAHLEHDGVCPNVEQHATAAEDGVEPLDAIKARAEGQATGWDRMVELNGGIGLLGIKEPALYEAMVSWQDSTSNEHADTVLALVSEVERLRGEVTHQEGVSDRLLTQRDALGARAEAVEAEADRLKRGIEALVRGAEGLPAAIIQFGAVVAASDLRDLLDTSSGQPDKRYAALTEPGGQVGEGLPQHPSIVAINEGRHPVVSTEVPLCGREHTPGRICMENDGHALPAPVVPDSTGLRERVEQIIYDAVYGNSDIPSAAEAVLAVVGQGVTGEATTEQIEAAGERVREYGAALLRRDPQVAAIGLRLAIDLARLAPSTTTEGTD